MSIATTTPPSTTRRIFSLWDAVSLPSTVNAAIAAVLATVFAAVTAVLILASPATYESRSTLSIDQPGAVAQSADTGIIEKLDRLRLKYAGLADTALILGPIARDEKVSLDGLRADTDVVVGPQSLLMFPTARASSRRTAEARANAVADGIVAYAAREQTANNIPAAERFRFSVVEDASSATQVAPSARSAVAAAALAAIFALGVAYVALQLVTANRRLS